MTLARTLIRTLRWMLGKNMFLDGINALLLTILFFGFVFVAAQILAAQDP